MIKPNILRNVFIITIWLELAEINISLQNANSVKIENVFKIGYSNCEIGINDSNFYICLMINFTSYPLEKLRMTKIVQ